MPANDLEVFEYLSADPQTSIHVDYLAYAIFTHDKHAWIDHYTTQNGRAPTQAEIDAWISNLTVHQFGRMMDTAVEFFDDAARKYLAAELATEHDKAFQAKLLATMTNGLSLRRQLGIAIVTAVVTPIILGIIIVAVLAYKDWYPAVMNIFPKTR